MNKKDLLFFSCQENDDFFVYHLIKKRAICVCFESGKITPFSITVLKKKITALTVFRMKTSVQFEYLKNNVLVEEIFKEFEKTQRENVPRVLLEECDRIITNVRQIQLEENAKSGEKNFHFFVSNPKRGGQQKIRVYDSFFKKAVTISNGQTVSKISTVTFLNELYSGSITSLERHTAEEYLSDLDLVNRILTSFKKQIIESTDDLGPMQQEELDDYVQNLENSNSVLQMED